MTSYRVLEGEYISDVEGCKYVWEYIRNIPRRGVFKKLLFLAFALNIVRECLLYVGVRNSKMCDSLTGSAIFRRME